MRRYRNGHWTDRPRCYTLYDMNSLITAQELRTLDHPDTVILDASAHLPDAERNAAQEFAAGHIPGARFLDLASFTDPQSPVPKAVPSPQQFSERMQALGISPDSRIILYDDSKIRTACRAWFIFRMNGMRNVALLDGGLQSWRDANQPLETGEPDVTPSEFPPPTREPAALRSKQDILANIERHDKHQQVVDARDAGRFSGATRDDVHDMPSGHIPGSCNLHFPKLLDDQGRFLSPDELRQRFEDAGIDWTRPVVATCGSGVTACVLLFALHLIGAPDTALYDGSWSEWGSDPDTPKVSA